MYKHRSKNDPVKLNSVLKYTDTDLSIGTQPHHSSCALTEIEGTFWSPSIWCRKPLHRRMSWILAQHHTKTATNTDVLLITRKHLAATSFKHQ